VNTCGPSLWTRFIEGLLKLLILPSEITVLYFGGKIIILRLNSSIVIALTSDVGRPLSYKTKAIYFFKTKTGQAKTKTTFSRPKPRLLFSKSIKLLNQDLKKTFPYRKNGPVKPVLPSHAGNRKKTCL